MSRGFLLGPRIVGSRPRIYCIKHSPSRDLGIEWIMIGRGVVGRVPGFLRVRGELQLRRLRRLGRTHVAVLALRGVGIVLLTRPGRDIPFHPLEAQGILELTLGEQGPGRLRMLVDHAMEQRISLVSGGRGLVTVLNGRVAHEPPRVGPGIL